MLRLSLFPYMNHIKGGGSLPSSVFQTHLPFRSLHGRRGKKKGGKGESARGHHFSWRQLISRGVRVLLPTVIGGGGSGGDGGR